MPSAAVIMEVSQSIVQKWSVNLNSEKFMEIKDEQGESFTIM